MALSAQDLAAFHAVQLPTAQAAAPKKKGNFLTNLLPTIGGTAGGIGGGALGGAAIGTALLPGVGTVAGGLLGALLGGGAGGALGKVAENKIEGNALGDGVLGAGIENGVLSAGPLRLLKAGKVGLQAAKGGVQSGLASALTRGTAPALEQTAGTTAASTLSTPLATAPLKTSIAGKLESFGNKQLSKEWGTLDSPTRKATMPAVTIPKLANMGVTSVTDAERIAKGITGSDGLLNQAVKNSIKTGTTVPVTSVKGIVDDSIIQRNLSGLPQEKTVKTLVDSQLTKLGDNPKASDVFSTIKRLQKQAADLEGAGGNYKRVDPTRGDMADVYRDVAKHLEDSVYKGAGVDKNLGNVLTPELRNKLVALHPNSTDWAKHVDENIMKSTSVKGLRSAQAPFVKANQMIENGADNAFSSGGQVAANTSGIKNALLDKAVGITQKPLGLAAKRLAKIAPGSVGAAPKDLASALTAPSAKQIIRNDVLGNATLGTLTGAGSANAAADPTANQTLDAGSAATQQLLPAATAPTTNDPFDPANVTGNIKKILGNGGTLDDVTKYLSIAETVGKLQSAGGSQKLNATTAGQVAASANGINTLGQLEGLYGQAGGGSGKIGGSIKNLLGNAGVDTSAATYNDLSASTVSQLAKALNGGGQVSDTDAAVIVRALPKITDSPTVAKAKFDALKQRLQAAQQNTLLYNTGSDDLSSALM